MSIDMDPETAHTLEVVIQFVLGPLAVLFVGWVLDRRSKRRIEAVGVQVQSTKKEITNEHTEHLRDDLDSKFDLIFGKFDTVFRKLDKQGRVLIAQRKDIAQLYQQDVDAADDVTALRKEIGLKK